MSCKISGCTRPMEETPDRVTLQSPDGEKNTITVCRFHKRMFFNLNRDQFGRKFYGSSLVVKTEELEEETIEEEETVDDSEENDLTEEELEQLTAPQGPVEGEEN